MTIRASPADQGGRLVRLFARTCATAVVAFANAVTGVRPRWLGCRPDTRQRIYFANHASHGDFVLIWSVLPPAIRRVTRPIAGADYWDATATRRFIAGRVFNAVLIDRHPAATGADPIATMAAVLDEGASIIMFPEGTRNTSDGLLLPLKSGLYRLALARPDVELIPTFVENLNRVMPKGEIVPVPLLCTVTFGAPLMLRPGEEKAAFLTRASDRLKSLAPRRGNGS
jgi:1-acyl-sn-glycerol-3-phosphate acyltransferase